jgi:proteasome lid subunit RPN8/RPN11
MIALGESLERTRNEKFMGWYHSHPFDLGDHSHCFMSQTDISTHLQWQRTEDPHGNPFVALVVDPLRSAHEGKPELKAFRAYPPEYTSPVSNECPDGSVEASEQVRLEHWGSCWNRYYELDIEYYMSQTSRKIMEQLTQDYLWIRKLTSKPDNVGKIVACAKQFRTATQTPAVKAATTTGTTSSVGAALALAGTSGKAAGGNRSRPSGEDGMSLLAGPNTARNKEWNKAMGMVNELANEQICESSLQTTKERLFS